MVTKCNTTHVYFDYSEREFTCHDVIRRIETIQMGVNIALTVKNGKLSLGSIVEILSSLSSRVERLEYLDLSKNQLDHCAVRLVLDMIRNAHNLNFISFSGNKINHKGMEHIVSFLENIKKPDRVRFNEPRKPQILAFDLSNNEFGRQSLKTLCKKLTVFSIVAFVDLSGNCKMCNLERLEFCAELSCGIDTVFNLPCDSLGENRCLNYPYLNNQRVKFEAFDAIFDLIKTSLLDRRSVSVHSLKAGLSEVILNHDRVNTNCISFIYSLINRLRDCEKVIASLEEKNSVLNSEIRRHRASLNLPCSGSYSDCSDMDSESNYSSSDRTECSDPKIVPMQLLESEDEIAEFSGSDSDNAEVTIQSMPI